MVSLITAFVGDARESSLAVAGRDKLIQALGQLVCACAVLADKSNMAASVLDQLYTESLCADYADVRRVFLYF